MRLSRAKLALVALLLLWAFIALVRFPTSVAAQESPTFTPSPAGPQVFSGQEEPNLRSGPGTEYDIVGILVKGQYAPIVGVIQIGPFTWFKIVYIGGPDNTAWVYKDLVRVVGDISTVPTILPPPTPTVRSAGTPVEGSLESTPTPNSATTRLPTFTPPALIARPTLLPAQGLRESSGIPPALIIASLFVLGLLAGIASLLRGR